MCNILKGEIMAFFYIFKRSAGKLKSLWCICATAVLIALDLALKSIMAFFYFFKRSARELLSLRCLCATAVLIALDLALKSITIYLPFCKISVAFVAMAAIGMFFGPVVGCMAGAITDILGLMITQGLGAYNPLFTIVEMTGGLLYGLFLYDFEAVKPDFSGGKAFFKSIAANWRPVLRIILAKLAVVIICNLILNTWFQVLTGEIVHEVLTVKIKARLLTYVIKFPFEIMLMLLTLYPIKSAYKAVFKKANRRLKPEEEK